MLSKVQKGIAYDDLVYSTSLGFAAVSANSVRFIAGYGDQVTELGHRGIMALPENHSSITQM
jgi:hypothetical protein